MITHHTHTLAEWASMISAAASGFATFSFFYFLLVEASLDPRPALRTAGDRALVEIVRAKHTVRDIPVTAAALLMLLTATPEAAR